MSANLAFELGSSAAVLGWLSLILGTIASIKPIGQWALCLGGRIIPLLLALLYLYLVIAFWGSAPNGNFSSLEGVNQLFTSPGNLAAGWIHFLAFDLFIGRWIIDDSIQERKQQGKQGRKGLWQLILCLPLTFMYGPTGLLLYYLFKYLSRSRKQRN
ncbi:ABA4-like family protein [Vibrio amylolyticus]|uniref:ABA4-like family protein n=2 Tax=Vibrionaceae TaxID=641 RepID=UPI00354B1437